MQFEKWLEQNANLFKNKDTAIAYYEQIIKDSKKKWSDKLLFKIGDILKKNNSIYTITDIDYFTNTYVTNSISIPFYKQKSYIKQPVRIYINDVKVMFVENNIHILDSIIKISNIDITYRNWIILRNSILKLIDINSLRIVTSCNFRIQNYDVHIAFNEFNIQPVIYIAPNNLTSDLTILMKDVELIYQTIKNI